MSADYGLIDGIGGIFLLSNDPAKLVAWYERCLGMKLMQYEANKSYGLEFVTIDSPSDREKKSTIFSIQKAKEPLAEGIRDQHVLNLRVLDLEATIKRLATEGSPIEKRQDSEYGNFAWVKDA